MFCRKCGTEIPDDSVFCPKCGTKVDEVKNGSGNIGMGSSIDNTGNVSTPISTEQGKKQNNQRFKILGTAAGAIAVVCLIMALLGVFDGIGEKIGEADIFKGNDTKSAFSDTRSSEIKNVKTLELMDYIDKTEDEVIDIFGFKKNDEHIYPGDVSDAPGKYDYCIMFMFDDSQRVYEVEVDEKTNEIYPDASVYGIKYGVKRAEAERLLEASDYSFLTEYETDDDIRASYYNSDYRTVTVVYVNGNVSRVGYSVENQQDLISELLAMQNDSESEENDDSVIFDESQISSTDDITRLYGYSIAFGYLSSSEAKLMNGYSTDANEFLTIPAGTILPVYIYSHSDKYIITEYDGVLGYVNTDFLHFSNCCDISTLRSLQMEYYAGNYHGIDNNSRIDLFFYDDLYELDSPAYSVSTIEYNGDSYDLYVLGTDVVVNGLYRDIIFYLKDQRFIDTGKTMYLAISATEDGLFAELLKADGMYDDLVSVGKFLADFGD